MMRFRLTFPSTTLLRRVEVDIAMPGGFTSARPPFKCLWALHCAMENGSFFLDTLGLGEWADSEGFAVVAPSLGNGYFLNSDYEQQADFLQELLLSLPEAVALSREREENAVLGISMGGFGALRWALQSRAFGSATAISGVFDCHIPPDDRLFTSRQQRALHCALNKTMRKMLLEPGGATKKDADFPSLFAQGHGELPKVHLFCGEEDWLSLPQTRAMAELCHRHDCPASLDISPGGHDPEYWRSILPKAVAHLFAAGR